MEELYLENNPETNDPLQKKFSEYIREINRLRRENNFEEIELLTNNILHILPSNVKSLSIPLFNDEETKYITAEREVEEDQQGIEWSFGNLIAYSISLRDEDRD